MDPLRIAFLGLLLITVPLAGCASTDDGDGGDGADGMDGMDGDGMDGSMEAHHAIMAKASEVADGIDTPQEAWDAGYRPDTQCIPGMGVHWINMEAFDTEFDEDVPEVVMFLPDSSNVDDWEGDTFLGIEYVVVTEGTDMNDTDSVPEWHGVHFEGPMPGHFPGMPWHAELHIYMAQGHESTEEFHEVGHGVECPQGTGPGEAQILAKARQVAANLTTTEAAMAAGYMPTSTCEPGMGVHWVNMPAFDPVFDPDAPEVVMFQPGPGGIYDHGAATFAGIEYVVVTEGTEMNTTDTVPVFHGRAFDGPMPGHFPGMPWHAEMHIYLGPDMDWPPWGAIPSEDEHSHFNEMVTCPEGTTAPPTAAANLRAVTPEGIGDTIRGTVALTEGPFLGSVAVEVTVEGLTPGEHGVHIHANGDCSPTGTGEGPVAAGAAGGHFNPDGASHGEHAGDLGNITVGEDGTGTAVFEASPLTLEDGATYGILNRSIIVHQDRDDGETDPSGNSGARVLCGVIAAA